MRTLEIGGTRTLIGIVAGICYGLLITLAASTIDRKATGMTDTLGLVLFFGGLLPVRFGEWYWLLKIIFKEKVRDHPRVYWSLGYGTLVSYALDAIGIAAAFVLPGGMWVC